MLGAPPAAVLHSELPGPLLLPISTTTEGQTEGSSVIGLSPLLWVKARPVACFSYPLGFPHHPASGPLIFPENGPEVELPTKACQAYRLPLVGKTQKGRGF